MIGIVGAICGGRAATVFHVHSLNGFFSLSAWLTAIAGAGKFLSGVPEDGQLIEGWRSVTVMGSCGIDHFARGQGAVDLQG
jgi:hypothetical protein